MLKHFNCFVQIVNKTDEPFVLCDVQNQHGNYEPAPPERIPAGEKIDFILNPAHLSLSGSAGSCRYRSGGGNTEVVMSYCCRPSLEGHNDANVLVDKSPAFHVEMIPNPLPRTGHPLKVQFTISPL